MDLPTLTEAPSRHPDCCVSLSSALLDTVTTVLGESIQSGLVLSVGSGTGLFEALLHSKWTSSSTSQNEQLQIEGVEVPQSTASASSSLNRYLPEQCSETVRGTWDLSSRAEQAAALMFVYPRHAALLWQYLYKYANLSSSLHIVIWLGPKCDWADVEPCFALGNGWLPVRVIEGEKAGLLEYEMMAVLRRSPHAP